MQDSYYSFSRPCCFSSGQSMKDEDHHSAKNKLHWLFSPQRITTVTETCNKLWNATDIIQKSITNNVPNHFKSIYDGFYRTHEKSSHLYFDIYFLPTTR
jgi:hypothetical protein